MNQKQMIASYKQTFETEPTHLFFAPGRINLIGEHTDYNGGHVFPAAITFGTYVLMRKREDDVVRFYSENFPEVGVIERRLGDLAFREEDDWANYPKAMLHLLQERTQAIATGIDMWFFGNIPNGAGLSSSASIELATAFGLNVIERLDLEPLELVKLGQRAENEYIGVNSGIMDQFAIGMGKRGHAMLLDCDTLACEYAPIDLDGLSIVIMNTNKRRELADSKYNERRAECETALGQLQRTLSIQSLGDVTPDTFESNVSLLQDETLVKRARHAVYENNRTLQALVALKENRLEDFGRLMNASHVSLRDDYEVTGKELDTLVEAAWANGAIGARMTGAGFGGCAIALVRDEAIDSFRQAVSERYSEEIGYAPTFYVASIGEGAHEMKLGMKEEV
ncbi:MULTISPECIES: galactokinase [Exiguobacterium]|uniref:galactokinase n=1 Tax=Exiguobacterium TaxID=33986 RepID=UPI001BEA6043|nr:MULTISPECIES: galactokinase [Exiguobacterium]MCT4777095.1 galactokinase [Exiguobacterium aquaticum]MCT4789845.1 galactokinase [Exiguobacterium mexicanum]